MRSIYVELPVEEAKKRLGSAVPEIARMVAALDDCRIEFVPAQGGCVIAVLPSVTPERVKRVPFIAGLTQRLKQRNRSLKLQTLCQALRTAHQAG